MYYLSVLEVRESKTGLTGLKSKYQQSWVPFCPGGGGGGAGQRWHSGSALERKVSLPFQVSIVCLLIHFSPLKLFVTLMDYPTRFLCPWDSPGKNTGVGCCALLQGIFLTLGLNPRLCHLCFLHWQMGSLP